MFIGRRYSMAFSISVGAAFPRKTSAGHNVSLQRNFAFLLLGRYIHADSPDLLKGLLTLIATNEISSLTFAQGKISKVFRPSHAFLITLRNHDSVPSIFVQTNAFFQFWPNSFRFWPPM